MSGPERAPNNFHESSLRPERWDPVRFGSIRFLVWNALLSRLYLSSRQTDTLIHFGFAITSLRRSQRRPLSLLVLPLRLVYLVLHEPREAGYPERLHQFRLAVPQRNQDGFSIPRTKVFPVKYDGAASELQMWDGDVSHVPAGLPSKACDGDCQADVTRTKEKPMPSRLLLGLLLGAALDDLTLQEHDQLVVRPVLCLVFRNLSRRAKFVHLSNDERYLGGAGAKWTGPVRGNDAEGNQLSVWGTLRARTVS
ncbi:hypothetical protein EDB85DRAFT_2275126 [Lactarius pseudohatsudake]|nr:hypothetical protein EDB85DRAFT_2275126 [Lactarius pseudohatsudake]